MRKMITLAALLFLFTCTAKAEQFNLGWSGKNGLVFPVTCATTATIIQRVANEKYTSLECGTLSATTIYIGASDVNTATDGTLTGWPLCTNQANCLGNVKEISVKTNQYCRVASGTQQLICHAVRL